MAYLHPSMQSTERMFAGSLISTPDRVGGMLAHLRSEILPENLEDEVAILILKSAMLAETTKWSVEPTPDNLAAIIIAEHLVNIPEGEVEALSDLQTRMIEKLKQYADMGVSNTQGINALASSIRDHVNSKRIAEYALSVSSVASDETKTATDRYDELAAALEAVRPNSIEARVYTVRDQIAVMRRMRDHARRLVGTKLMTFPSEWWLSDMIPYILPGLLYTVTGLTGRGKSSILQQIADHLSRCGFKVMYFHAEDDIERQLTRMAQRMAKATRLELLAGDPNDKFRVVADTIESRLSNGGEIIFSHCIGQPVSYIRSMTQAYKPDVIIVDYLQKLNRAPQMKMFMGNEPAALAQVVEELKQVAENDKHMCAVIMGSQEAQHDSGVDHRKGTAGTRQAEHKSQVVIEFDRPVLTEADQPEVGMNGVLIAGPGQQSGFGYMSVDKNNDGPTGSVTGVFHGSRFEFKSLLYRRWERAHPGQLFAIPTLEVPDENYYRIQADKDAAWDDLDLAMAGPKERRADAKKSKGTTATNPYSGGGPRGRDDDDSVPF